MSMAWLARGEPHLPPGDDWLSPGERAYALSKPFTKRRREFLVARWTLKQATVLALELPDDPGALASIEARHAADGAPELYLSGTPASYDVSMTDRAGWAVCVLAPAGSAVGVDLELVEPRSDTFVGDYLTPAEQRCVDQAARDGGRDAHDLVANLLWSAKESALKVLRTGLRRDTRSVEVTVDNVMGSQGVWLPLSARTADGEVFEGWWRRRGAFVLTTCARVALPEPESLETPPALDAATPLHSWVAEPHDPSR